MLRWIDTVFPRKALFQRDRRLLHLFVGRVLASTGFSIVSSSPWLADAKRTSSAAATSR
jgi:hypothetical protein